MVDVDRIEEPLKFLDKFDLSNAYERRLAFKIYLDTISRALLFCCTRYFGWREETIKPQGLKVRWEWIKDALKVSNICSDNDLKRWNKFIDNLWRVRNKIEHNDLYAPDDYVFKDLDKEVKDFLSWIAKKGKEYLKKSKNFTTKQVFYSYLDFYIREGEYFLNILGDKPHLVERDVSLGDKYPEIKELLNLAKNMLKDSNFPKDLTADELRILFKLIEVVSRIDTAESICISFDVCPKCGDKIEESEIPLYHHYEDESEPYAVKYRVGCKKCDYTLNEEIEYI